MVSEGELAIQPTVSLFETVFAVQITIHSPHWRMKNLNEIEFFKLANGSNGLRERLVNSVPLRQSSLEPLGRNCRRTLLTQLTDRF